MNADVRRWKTGALAGLGLACWLCAGFARGQEFTPPAPQPGTLPSVRSVFSADRRFLVSGFPAVTAANLLRWSEEVARHLERKLGPLPGERGWYVEVRGSSGDTVVRAQGWADGFLQQQLEVPKGSGLDEEDALEGLVWLLLNRWPIAQQTQAQRVKMLAVVPDWVAVGMAQQGYPHLRRRNTAEVLERWRAGTLTPWAEVVEREILPAGRWSEKAQAALLVAWLEERHAAWDELWRSCAQGQRMSADEVARRVAGFQSVEEAAASWDVWLSAQQERRRDFGSLDPAQVEELQALTRFDESELQTVQASARAPLMLADLVAERRNRWAVQLATRRVYRIRMAMTGRAPEWQATAALYVRFLESLSGYDAGYTGGLFGRGPSARQLLKLLAEADESLVALRREVQARTEFMDRAEAARAQPSEPVDPAIQQFLDEAERRR